MVKQIRWYFVERQVSDEEAIAWRIGLLLSIVPLCALSFLAGAYFL